MKTIKITLGLIALLIVISSCGGAKKEKVDEAANQPPAEVTKIVGMASVEPQTRIVSLYSDVGGIVDKINYDINSEVKANDVIFVLNTEVEEAQLAQAKSKLGTQQAMINVAKAQLASLKVKQDNAQVNYNRNINLLKAGAVTQQVTDDSKFAYESLQNDVLAADAGLKQQDAKVSELQADINYYEKVIDKKTIKAPTNGKILSVDVRLGNNVLASQSVGDFAPDGPLIAITEVDELFATKVTNGMKAYIRPQGQLDTLATGKIYLTSPYLRKKTLFSDDAANMEDRRVREVRVLLDKSDKVLIGSRVECVILLK
jgi:multidrug efflux pump subunit AcrA (membrane-fusion protein)